MAPVPAYRFADFLVSRRRRQVWRGGEALPLIPRYFDLLVLLIERRPRVVTRREIFDEVWKDVIVSDGALTQAVRTLRRTLGDDPREPSFIRTVSRHGYSFVFAEVLEEDEEQASPPTPAVGREARAPEDQVAALVTRLLGEGGEIASIEDRRDAAQQLHTFGTALALRHVLARPTHAEALALLRDTRWNVPGAGAVPLWGQREGARAALRLVRWRAREALRVTERRWAQAAGGAAAAGAAAGLVGGTLLAWAPGASAPPSAIVVLMVLGALAGFAGAAGVAAGIAGAEAVARSRRAVAIVVGGAIGGLAVGWLLEVVVEWTLRSVFGLAVPLGGPVEGLSLGAGIAAAYAATTSLAEGGMAAPRGAARWRTALGCAGGGALVATLLSLSGHRLVGGLINAVTQASSGSQITFGPLGAWIGEPSFGPITQTLVAAAEGALFGFGLAWGLTRRPGQPR